MQWIEGFLLVLLFIAMAMGADYGVSLGLQRLKISLLSKFGSTQHSILGLRYSFVRLGLRLLIWGSAILVGLGQVPQMAPASAFIQSTLQTLFHWLNRAINLTLIDLGSGNRITLINLFAIIGIAIVIFFASNVLGRWIKQKVLRKTRIERGSQEAIAALISYVIAIFGFIILLQSMGLNLSSLTVFAGVIGIGFGLGLQELAKNFVSGLTLLFEQQLRVGDFVDVDGVLGTIEEISIRSTILRTQDRLYVVVPNYRFFENNVTNWSYKTSESRIHLPVNVAYGTDTLLVTEALISVARHEPKVLKYPAPQVWFKNFGESSLAFELLVWINQPHESLPIQSALNFSIDTEFRRRGISIPFPQREVWVRNSPPPDPTIPADVLSSKPGISESRAENKVKSSNKAIPISKRNLRQLLRGVHYFSQCTNAQLLFLIEQGFRQYYKAEEAVFLENEVGECFYLILAGTVEVYSERLERLIATLSAGEFFGEISLFTGVRRSATVRTLDDTTLFVVDRRALKGLMQDYNELAEQIARTLVARQKELEELGLGQEHRVEQHEKSVFSLKNRIKTLFGI